MSLLIMSNNAFMCLIHHNIVTNPSNRISPNADIANISVTITSPVAQGVPWIQRLRGCKPQSSQFALPHSYPRLDLEDNIVIG